MNYKREIYALAHLNLSTASFKCLSICFMLIINKHFYFCCFRSLAYTTLDRLCAVFIYNISCFIKVC